MHLRRLLFALLLLLPSTALAADPQLNGVAAALGMNYPQLQFQRLGPTPIDGLFEVVTASGDIVYFAPRSGHMVFGELWSNDARNLTRESQAKLMTAKASLFPLEKALKIGNGPNQVIEVADPDCPFCREGSAFFAGRKDVTRYVFLYPLEKIHPQAAAKARYVLSAEEPILAYEEVMGGHFDSDPLPDFVDNGLLDEHLAIAKKIGIRGTPKYWINGQFVSGTNLQEIERRLGR